ncbi:phage tail protein [Paenibacillus naphthalenovorans]|uniref:phage tail protein n=1 Tax=Paenibacillus naphthalenovorans TaxID=162209 RepID=UPI003D2A4686
MIGFFGDIVFETSDRRILTFQGLQRDSAARWAKHDAIGRKPASEFLGPDLDTITFTVMLNGNYGVKPRDEMERWLIKSRTGEVETLVIGNRGLGVDRWKVLSVSQAWNVVMNRGELFSGQVDITLEEYLGVLT